MAMTTTQFDEDFLAEVKATLPQFGEWRIDTSQKDLNDRICVACCGVSEDKCLWIQVTRPYNDRFTTTLTAYYNGYLLYRAVESHPYEGFQGIVENLHNTLTFRLENARNHHLGMIALNRILA